MAWDMTTVVTINSFHYFNADRESNNSDKDLQKDDELEFLPGTLYGKEHPWFWRIHITALVSLGTSIIFSAGTLIFLLSSGKDWNIFKRKFSERLIVYLAVADILYSTEHSFGHSYAVAVAFNNGSFNNDICLSSSFMLVELFMGQGIIITVTALSAFLMVVLNRKITFGRNDWILLICSFGIPAVPGVVFAVLGWFGPSGFWCLTDYSTSGGPIIALFYSIFPVVVSAIITVCYIGVWITIQIQTRRMNRFNEGEKAKEERRKYQKTAQVLTLFIVSYVAQWLPWIVYCIWSFVTPPPTVMINLVAATANMGGVFNFFAYTFVRRSTSSNQQRRQGDTSDTTSSMARTISTVA